MKYTSINHILFFASIAISTIHSGLAVPRPGPASKALLQHQRRTRDQSSSSFGLLVDREGNLYSPRITKEDSQRKDSSLQNRALSLRGGEVYVDNEGNFYTPTEQQEVPQVKAQPVEVAPRKTPSSFALRGGSHGNNFIGGLSVDSEGNLFATQDTTSLSATPPSTASSSALSLRGGSLCVDNEGNFYTPCRLEQAEEPRQTRLSSNRRLKSNGTNDEVLLTQNRLSKKIALTDDSSSTRAKTRKSLTADDPMAFIGYNNALMET